MRFVIVTGISGSGKSLVVRSLEDMGFFCIDNMPPTLISKFAEMCYVSNSSTDQVALVVDIRGRSMFKQLASELENMNKLGYKYEVLYLTADDETLVKRYKETRRKHPFDDSGSSSLLNTIKKEREILKYLYDRATYIIDTSNLTPKQLRGNINDIFSSKSVAQVMNINIMSFGFKYGIPLEADLVFDVRFLPNPFYEEDLKAKTGNDKEVRDYVMRANISKEFFEKLRDMIFFLLPNYIEEGKSNLVIAIGCTGGKHRSVTLARLLGEEINKKFGEKYVVLTEHRDIQKV